MQSRSYEAAAVEQGAASPITLMPLFCGVVLSLLASLFAPLISLPGSPLASGQPYPSSTYVTVSSIDPIVLSVGDTRAGDNWPSTWADDNNIYTYLGDGTGFGLPSAKSMSPAKIVGNPATGISGQNISTNLIGTSSGGGAGGRKVSGLVALPASTSPSGHVLFAWVRNITNDGGASLMYSYDHAASWAWAWGNPATSAAAILPELGYPTWMQAGKNNAAAQDGYLYFYSQDAPTAYQVTDNVIMGRVEKTRMKVKSAYRYFAGMDGKGNPLWVSNIARRKPVFTAQRQCYRVFVTFNPVLKRYFLLTADGDSLNSNWRSGHQTHNMGIYEAPTPWGPWQTVYYNNQFQAPMNVFAAQMVPKWITADGKSFYLLYSSFRAGPYRYNIQKVNLKVE